MNRLRRRVPLRCEECHDPRSVRRCGGKLEDHGRVDTRPMLAYEGKDRCTVGHTDSGHKQPGQPEASRRNDEPNPGASRTHSALTRGNGRRRQERSRRRAAVRACCIGLTPGCEAKFALRCVPGLPLDARGGLRVPRRARRQVVSGIVDVNVDRSVGASFGHGRNSQRPQRCCQRPQLCCPGNGFLGLSASSAAFWLPRRRGRPSAASSRTGRRAGTRPPAGSPGTTSTRGPVARSTPRRGPGPGSGRCASCTCHTSPETHHVPSGRGPGSSDRRAYHCATRHPGAPGCAW